MRQKPVKPTIPPANDQEQVRQQKLFNLKNTGNNPFAVDRFTLTGSIGQFIARYDHQKLDSEKPTKFRLETLAGRIFNVRSFGQIIFLMIGDRSGKIQLFCQKKNVNQSVFQTIAELDRGDVIGCWGTAMMTKTNQLSLKVSNLVLLAKSIKVWPNKFQGLVSLETKYRQRYLDLVLSDQSRLVFINRAKIIHALRTFLHQHDYLEVETPILETNFGGANARPFVTRHNTYNRDFYLRIAPELALKKLIIGGLEKVYELGRVFRNEGIDANHSPEFTTLELYTAYQNMIDAMDVCEHLLRFCCQMVFQTYQFKFQQQLIDFEPPFQRIHILDLIKQKLKYDFWVVKSFKAAKAVALHFNLKLDSKVTTTDQIIVLLFEKLIEPSLINPTFVFGHPASLSPLAKTNLHFSGHADRFELYVGGMELANAYSELNDPFQQLIKFQNQLANQIPNRIINDDYVQALAHGMPPCAGLGIGVDRVIMLLTNCQNIRDVILFPTLKPKKIVKK